MRHLLVRILVGSQVAATSGAGSCGADMRFRGFRPQCRDSNFGADIRGYATRSRPVTDWLKCFLRIIPWLVFLGARGCAKNRSLSIGMRC